jgi:hypothetical protein
MTDDKDKPTLQQVMERIHAMRTATNVEELFKAGFTPRRIREEAAAEFGNFTARYAFEITSACGHLLNTLEDVYEAAGVVASLAEEFCEKAKAASEDVPVPDKLKQ